MPALVVFTVFAILLPRSGHGGDLDCWQAWSTQMLSGGIVNAYDIDSRVNYLPLYMYVLRIYGLISGSVQACYENVFYLKLFTWLFDTAGILLICGMVKAEESRLRYFIYGVLNVGIFYNTIIWGQVDSILAFLVFSSVLSAYFRRLYLSAGLFILAINFKLQSIIFGPLLILMWLPSISIKRLAGVVLLMVSLQAIILLPFLINGNVKNILKVVSESVDHYPIISMNAFNFWYVVISEDKLWSPDTIRVTIFTYKQVGLILFIASSAVVLIPLLINYLKNLRKKTTAHIGLEQLLLTCTIVGYSFFFFNTQMHERYIHPVLIFVTAQAFLYNRWGLWILITVNYALSLETIIKFLGLHNYEILFFNLRFQAYVFLIGLIWSFILWNKSRKGQVDPGDLPADRLTTSIQV